MSNNYKGNLCGNNKPSLVVVAAVNNREILAKNLQASPMLKNNNISLITKEGYDSASHAYNEAIDSTQADIIIFAHQDVYFPKGWETKLLATIETLESSQTNWGVLGVIGANEDGKLLGEVWATGLKCKIKSKFKSPAPACTFDEVVIVLRRDSGVRFDPNLPGFHLYATDIVLSSLKAGFGAYVFDAPIIHNSVWCEKFGNSYYKGFCFMQKKWWHQLPAHTLVIPITKTKWPLLRIWRREKKRWIFRKIIIGWPKHKYVDPESMARDLGYDLP
jgi:hypothetical protein